MSWQFQKSLLNQSFSHFSDTYYFIQYINYCFIQYITYHKIYNNEKFTIMKNILAYCNSENSTSPFYFLGSSFIKYLFLQFAATYLLFKSILWLTIWILRNSNSSNTLEREYIYYYFLHTYQIFKISYSFTFMKLHR